MTKTLDQAIDDLDSRQSATESEQLTGGVRMSLDVDHDKQARVQALAETLGEQDLEFVERNFDYLDAASRAQGLYKSLPEQSVARRQLLDPKSPGYDDVETIAKVEGGLVGMARDVKASLPKGRDVHAGGNEAFSLMITGADDQTYGERMAGYNERMNRQSDAGLNWFQKIPGDTAEMVGLYSGMVPGMLKSSLAAGLGAATARPEAALPAAAVGFKIGSAKEMFQVEAGWAFDEFRQLKDETGATIDRDAATGAALLAGGINAGLEFVGFNNAVLNVYGLPRLLKGLGKEGVKSLLKNPALREKLATIAKDYSAGVLSEGGTEALQEITLVGFDMLLTGTVGNIEEYGGRILESFNQGARAAIGLGAPAVAVRTTAATMDSRKAKQQQDAFAALGQDVASSKLYSRAPKQFQEFIRKVQAQHGLVDTVYMDNEAATTYFQNVDPDQLARDMPETAKALQVAQETGEYVAIPLDEFVTYVAPNMDQVAPDITFDPLTPTKRQMDQVESASEDLLKQYQETQALIDREEDPVYGRVYVELLGAGRKADVAEREALLFTTLINRLAERQGVDPLEYYRSKKISIRGEVIQQEGIEAPTYMGGLLNILREGRAPAQRDVFGKSAVEYLMDLGIKDEGGELANRDLDKPHPNYGRRRLARENGLDMSEAFERLRDAGYLDEAPKTGEDQVVLDAIDRELAGNAIYAPNQLSPQMQELSQSLDELNDLIQKAGFDLDAMSNEEILERLGILEVEQGEPSPTFKAAMDKLLADKSGEIEAALYNPAVGPIDIVWGQEGTGEDFKGGYGLAKILAKHPEIDPYQLESIIASAKLVSKDQKRVVLETPNHMAAIRLDWHGEKKTWLVTAFEPGKRPVDNGRGSNTQSLRTDANLMSRGDGGSGKGSIAQPTSGGRGPRGYLEISPQRLTITLTKKANLSTFIHETGHLFLELMKDAAGQPDAPADLLQDWETIKAYLGSDGDFTTEQHETWARSFEAYLFEGKAPSQELAGLFNRFKSWLMSVYKTIRNLDVELTDEVRQVFDRMLVAERSVEEVSADMVATFDGSFGLSEAEYQNLVNLQQEAIQAGQDDMAAQAMAEVRRMRQQTYRERKEALKEEVTQEVDADPVYAVQRLLRTGNDENMNLPEGMAGAKLSSQAVIDLFADSKILRRIPGLTRKEHGVHPDAVADLYGFESGYHMIQKIIAAPPRSRLIAERVQNTLDDEFGNMAQDTETVERAAAALHNRKMETFLMAEARAINRKLGRKDNATTLNQATKEAARRHVAGLALRQIRPYSYYQAEMKAARATQEAVAAGKFEEAARLKQQQLLNHHLYREASKAVDRAEVIRGKVKKFESPKYMARIRRGDPNAANAIDALLSGVELKRTAIKQIDARRKLAEYVQAMEKKGEPVMVDPQLYMGAELVNWREMTLDQLEQLDSSIQALAKQGRDADKIRVEGELVEMAQVIEDLDAVASNNMTRKEIDRYSVDHRSPITRIFTSFMASLRKIEFECRFADGDITGKWHRTIFQPFVDAQNAKNEMLDGTVGELKEIMGSISRDDARRLDADINFLGVSLKRGDLYVVALNMGNQGNWDRLFSRRWKGQERQVMQRIQEELTLEDFRRIEALGQMVDRFYEPMAAVSERVDGIRPPKVEAKPLFLDKYGVELSGWYYPVKYQDAVGTREQSVLEESNSIDMGSSPITGQVSKSMTKDRMAGAGGVISLDFSGLPQHLHQVVHYVTHYEAVRNFDKLRKKSEFRSMYESYFDQNGYKQLRSWLQNIATNGTIAQTSHDASKTMDSIFRRARYGGSLIGLGWKVSSALMQTLGAGPAAKELGAARMSRWLLQLSYQRLATSGQARVHPAYQAALDASPELKHLDSQIDRDIREFTDQAVRIMRRKPGMQQAQWVMDQAYYMIIGVQRHINAATWLAAHEKAQEEGMTVQESVQYADAAVRQTQSGGGLKDLAGVQQGNELTKLVTLFYTYFSVQHNQLRLTGRQDLLRGFWQGQGPHGRLKSLGKFAAANFFIVIAPALVEGILRRDEDEDEDTAPYLVKRIASTYVAGLPIFRDIYGAATRNFSAPSTPLDQVVQSLVKGLDSSYDLAKFEAEWADWRNVSKAATLVTWLPFYQIYNYTEALAASKEFSEKVSNVMFGTPYSKRKELDD